MSMKKGDFVFNFLFERLKEESLLYERMPNLDRLKDLSHRWGYDDEFTEKERFRLIQKYTNLPKKDMRILDMAAGCGSFFVQGNNNGYNVYGVEPEKWKLQLIEHKIESNGYNQEWKKKCKEGVGEALPFDDLFFDVVDSWQTFEHVQDVEACLLEIFRTLKLGGIAIIRAPSYLSFFEGHYRIMWWPLMPKPLASLYLKLRKRPLKGLETFHNIYYTKLANIASRVGFKVRNIKKIEYKEDKFNKWGLNRNSGSEFLISACYYLSSLYHFARSFNKYERHLHILLEKRDQRIDSITR